MGRKMRIIKLLWVILGILLTVIGLGGLPDELAQWASWLGIVQPMLNDSLTQWLSLFAAASLFFGGIAYGGSTLSLPFRRRFRYWLNAVEQYDNVNLVKCLPLQIRQVELQYSQKKGIFLRFNMGIFNGSVYSLKCSGVTGEPPMLVDQNPEEKTILPPLQVAGNLFHDLHHAAMGTLVLDIPLTERLVEKVRSGVERNRSGYSNGRFDLRNTVAVVVAKETGLKHVIPLLNIHISEARPIGLDLGLSALKDKGVG